MMSMWQVVVDGKVGYKAVVSRSWYGPGHGMTFGGSSCVRFVMRHNQSITLGLSDGEF